MQINNQLDGGQGFANGAAAAAVAGLNTKGGVFYPEDFGPLSTTEAISHTAIQAAIDAAFAAGGGTVILPPKRILIGASVTPRNGVHLQGTHPGSQSVSNSDWGSYMQFTSGTILSFPGGVVFQKEEVADSFAYLAGFSLKDIGFESCLSILKAGAHNKSGMAGCYIRDIVGRDITGSAFDLTNILLCNFYSVKLVYCERGFYIKSDGTRPLVVDGANTYFGDCFIEQRQTATPAFTCEIMADSEHPINLVTLDNFQVNRFKSVALGKVGSHIELLQANGYQATNFVGRGIDVEGAADSAINIQGGFNVDISIRAITPGDQNRTVNAVQCLGSFSSNSESASIDFNDNTTAGRCIVSGSWVRCGTSNKRPSGYYYDISRGARVVQFGPNDWQSTKLSGAYRWGWGGAIQVGFDGGVQPVWGKTAYSGATVNVALNDGPTVYLTGSGAQAVNVGNDSNASGFRRRFIKTLSGGTATLSGVAGGDITMATQYCSVEIEYDGTVWYLVNKQGT